MSSTAAAVARVTTPRIPAHDTMTRSGRESTGSIRIRIWASVGTGAPRRLRRRASSSGSAAIRSRHRATRLVCDH